jgi:hypothetical protein
LRLRLAGTTPSRTRKDFEATIASATAFLYAASVLPLIRRMARSV